MSTAPQKLFKSSQRPDHRSEKNFKQWFRSGISKSVLQGRDLTLFEDEEDLVTLTTSVYEKFFQLIMSMYSSDSEVPLDSNSAIQQQMSE